MTYQRGEARATLADAEAADLVIASYMIGEIERRGTQSARRADVGKNPRHAAGRRARHAGGLCAGSSRCAQQLIAPGAHVAAPCPHDGACPLAAPDWCHFTQRLPRSRAHKQLKAAELPYEDEKFIYVALTRAPVTQRPARVLAQPVITKVAVTAKLCTDRGVVSAVAPRRDKIAYARFRRLNWGDAAFEAGIPSTE